MAVEPGAAKEGFEHHFADKAFEVTARNVKPAAIKHGFTDLKDAANERIEVHPARYDVPPKLGGIHRHPDLVCNLVDYLLGDQSELAVRVPKMGVVAPSECVSIPFEPHPFDEVCDGKFVHLYTGRLSCVDGQDFAQPWTSSGGPGKGVCHRQLSPSDMRGLRDFGNKERVSPPACDTTDKIKQSALIANRQILAAEAATRENMLEDPISEPAVSDAGAVIKRHRKRLKMTLADVASATGLSMAHVSRIERGERAPSLGVLFQLSRAYRVPLGKLVGEEEPVPGGVRHASGTEPGVRAKNVSYHPLGSTDTPGAVRIVRVDLAEGSSTPPSSHPGSEWLYVIQGNVVLRLDTETWELGTGDLFALDGERSHRLNCTSGPAKVLLVTSSPPDETGDIPLP